MGNRHRQDVALDEIDAMVKRLRALPKTTYVTSESMGRIDSWIPGVEFITSPYVPAGTIYVISHPELLDGKG